MVLILTLQMDPNSFTFFDSLRRAHFPSERNFIPAHLTLFHHLPGDRLASDVLPALDRHRRRASVPLVFPEVRFMGYGTSVRVESPELTKLREDLRSDFDSFLIPQDRQKFQPHITIQNKVPAPTAKDFFARFSQGWQPREGQGTGFLLWEYLGGPWRLVQQVGFH